MRRGSTNLAADSQWWLPEHVVHRTRVLNRTALHAAVTGCGARVHAMAHAAMFGTARTPAGTRTVRTKSSTSSACGIGLFQIKVKAGDLSLADMLPKRNGKGSWRDCDRALIAHISAVQDVYCRLVCMLVSAGVDVNAGDIDGISPIMLAARFGLVRELWTTS